MSEKIRVLRILNRFNLGGPVYNASYLSKYLEDEFETMLIGGKQTDEEENALYIPRSMGIEPVVIEEMSRSVNLMDDLKSLRRINKIIQEYRPDIVHTHASKAGTLGRLAAARNRVPVIVHTYHGHVFEHYFSRFKSGLIKLWERLLGRHTDAIICISQKQKEDIIDRFKIAPEEKGHIIHLGFELEKYGMNKAEKRTTFRKKHGIKDGDVAVGIIGRLAPVKNHHFFLEGLAELKEKSMSFKAFVIGDGSLRKELEKRCEELKLSTKGGDWDVRFTSWEKEVSTILPGLDIVVLTSLNEGTPVSLIEAQSAGIPVISSDVGGVKDVVSKQAGLLYKSGDLEEFTRGLKRLIQSEEMRAEMGLAGSQWALEKFTADRLARDTKKLYLELLKSSNS